LSKRIKQHIQHGDRMFKGAGRVFPCFNRFRALCRQVPTFSSLRKVSADAALRVWAISPVRGDQSHPESHLFSNVANDSIRQSWFSDMFQCQSIIIYPISNSANGSQLLISPIPFPKCDSNNSNPVLVSEPCPEPQLEPSTAFLGRCIC
jgi:hypothetical protein